MRGAVLVAIAATMGNLLQGWDNSTIAGAVLYVKKEFNLETQPTIEGLILAMSLIGATAITTFSGVLSDSLGRRPMLIISSLMYFTSGLIMAWAPNVYVLLLARLLDGFAIGLAVILTPVYISETAPSEIRGLLNTIPQFVGSGGMFLAYCLVFAMSLKESPSWRSMLGVICGPSFGYLLLAVFFLPESPRWLVSKGRMLEAKKVLQRLLGKEDVSGELALLVEGLNVQPEASVEEYIVFPLDQSTTEKDKAIPKVPSHSLMLATPLTGQSSLNMAISGTKGSPSKSISTKDPIVSMFNSVHEPCASNSWSALNLVLPNAGSVPSAKNSYLDLESQNDGEDSDVLDDHGGALGTDDDDNLQTPLLSREGTGIDKDHTISSYKSNLSMRLRSRLGLDEGGEQVSFTDIGSGWQMAWKLTEKESENGKKEEQVTRIYLHQDHTLRSACESHVSVPGVRERELAHHAAAVVSQSILSPKELRGSRLVEPVLLHSPKLTQKGLSWRDMCEPGIKQALLVGVGLQILQQVAGINGILYYAPQILKQAGVAVLLTGLGIGTDSASFLISCLITLSMLPCIAISMRLMDVSGRRSILLATFPILVVSLLMLVVASIIHISPALYAIVSTSSILGYLSCFQMGFGIIPNILCAEIFPTRVRGLCITICALTYWIGNMTITYTLPVLLSAIGLAGVFSVFAVGCVVSWVFVSLKVPETKGMPLEVISEFFAAGARKAGSGARND